MWLTCFALYFSNYHVYYLLFYFNIGLFETLERDDDSSHQGLESSLDDS